MKYWQRIINFPLIICFAIFISLQLSLILNLKAQNFLFEGNKKKGYIDFDLVKNLIIIPIFINDKGPYDFILDTGVGSLIITDPSLKDSLSLTNLRETKIYGLGEGEEIEALATRNISVKIKDAKANYVYTSILKNDIFNLSGYVGKKIYGLIGYPFFNSFIVNVNYINKNIRFYLPNINVKKRGLRLPLEIKNNKPYINADIKTPQGNYENIKLIVDCGASHSLLLDALNGKAFPLPNTTIPASLGVGLSGKISGLVGRSPSFKLGNYELKNVICGYPDFKSVAAQIGFDKQNGNIGAEILRRFSITYDYPNSSIYLKSNSNFSEPFEHDMSGMEVYVAADDNKRFFIGRIEKGSPAEKSGFFENDEIIGVNFKSIESYTLQDISNLLKSENGQAVLIEVFRDNQNIIKLLKLKKRI